MVWKVSWQVLVDGSDVTGFMRPYLMDIDITDKDGTASDTCSLSFDDKDGQIRLPREGARVQVFLQGAQAFVGIVDSVTSSGSRGGGRILKIGAKGFDSRGKVKEPQAFHKDDTTLKDFLNEAAQNAQLVRVEIDPEFALIHRDYWSADGESFLHLGQRLARELGATFKIRGDRVVFSKRGTGTAPSGAALATVSGIVGQNVMAWDIAPFTGRRSFTRTNVTYFDRKSAQFKTEEVDVEQDRDLPESVNCVRSPAKDQDQAKAIGKARQGDATREGGGGTVELDLTVEAQAEGTFILSGARLGVDGTYRITSVKHKATRSAGAITAIEIKKNMEK